MRITAELPTFKVAPAFPFALVVAADVVVTALTDCVTAPPPRPPLATGAVVTVERVLEVVVKLEVAEIVLDDAADDLVAEDAAEGELEDDEPELDEPPEVPSALMLCHEPDMSL
jgi:hypothetical protein